MSGFDKHFRSEADRKIGHTPRSCNDCSFAEASATDHPCDSCQGPESYWTPKGSVIFVDDHLTREEADRVIAWWREQKHGNAGEKEEG